nr:asparagine synthase (glutamine-hydrolyzing) [Bacilli bacterium]
MCGIVGYFGRNENQVDPVIIREMAQAIIHRGPDDGGFYDEDPIHLGFRRLSIIDVAGGHQPLANEDDSIWITFNGEIYNYQELREDLLQAGHVFKTHTDTEVIVHLYEQYGTDCLVKLRGMFAFAIWDRQKQQLFVARDLFGIKPLYYYWDEERFAFASEIKSLLVIPQVSREVDRESFWQYLTFQYVPEPRTMFEAIKKLPAAHYMVIDENGIKIERYDELRFSPVERPISYYIEHVLEKLRESVRAHMVSDVPRGAFLSSGVDSSAIVALLREMEEVKTFTVGFEGAGGQSEIAFARETAQLLKTEHHDTVISAKTYLETLPKLVYQQDEPVADPSAIALHFVAELASEHVTVVLSGEGADEIFGGYTIYREPLSLKMFDYLPPSIRRAFGETAKMLPYGMKGKSFLTRGAKRVEERFFGNANLYSDEEKQRFVKGKTFSTTDVTRPIYHRVAKADDVTKMQYLDLHTWLPGDILMKADKMTMTNSLELRVPFLDKEVFALASQIPASYRLQNNTTKYVLREAVKPLLPEAVATRKKLGFPVPTRQWLRNEHYAFVKELISSSPCDHLFDKKYVLAMLEEHKNEVRDHARKIWAIVIFLLWHQIYVQGTRPFQSSETPIVQARRQKMKEAAGV